jgi:hypothetical protein
MDTTTSGGKLIFHVFGALAEFQRELIRERGCFALWICGKLPPVQATPWPKDGASPFLDLPKNPPL